jgi:transposase
VGDHACAEVIMALRGRKPKPFELVDEDRTRLRRLVEAPTVDNRVAVRARILLWSGDGMAGREVARRLEVSSATVSKWKDRYRLLGFDGLDDAPRTGRPSNITDEKVAEVVKLTLEEKPKGATHWSTRDLARRTGLNQTRVSRIWRAFSLRPHMAETFQISTDPQFIEKVHDVVGLYLHPPANSVVFSVDEKTQVQALNRTQAILPTRPGMVERRTPEYRRHGTTDLFAALDVATSKVIAKCMRRHTSKEFIAFLRLVDDAVEAGLDIHAIVDNHSAHKSVATKAFLARHPRIHLHFTPTHASWLNLVEGFFAVLTVKALQRGSHSSVPQLEAAIYDFTDEHNDSDRAFRWVKTADDILERVAKYCGSVLAAHGQTRNGQQTSDSTH